MYVCVCKSVTDRQIRAAVRAGATTLEALEERLGLGTNCGTCLPCAAEVLRAALRADADSAAGPDPGRGLIGGGLPAFA